MSAQNVIELGFNVDELTSQKKQVLDLFVDLFGKLEEYNGTRFDPLGNGGLADLKKSLTDGAQAMGAYTAAAQKYNDTVTQQGAKQAGAKKSTDDLTAAQKEAQRVLDQLTQAKAKNTSANSDNAQALAAEREALRQRNAELRTAAQLQAAEEGSINEAKAAIAQLTAERNKQNVSTDEGRAKIAELNAEIDKNNEAINENSASLEKRKINIGNYAESLSPAFKLVTEQLENINAQISALEAKGTGVQNFGRTVVSGFGGNQHSNQGPTAFAGGSQNSSPVLAEDAEAYQNLTIQQKILQQSLDRQTVGFKTANQELRNTKNTLDALSLAGAENTEVFEKLNIAYTTAEQRVKDLHREQAILTTDAPTLTALTAVARGLGGAYAIGAGAAQLFADGNEKVEKELNKLVAIMTFLQGLEEAVASLKERNAIATELEGAATKALNLVKAIEVSLFGKSKAVIEGDAAAKVLNTAATEENTVASEANAAAVEATGVAAEGAEAATIGLRTALVGIGIGAIIVGVALLVAKIIEWSEAENKAAKDSAELAEAMEKVNEILLERIRLSDEDSVHTKKNLEDALTLADKSKQAYNDIYSIKKAQADLDQKTAQGDLLKAANTKDLGEAYRTVDGQVKSLTANLDPLLKKQDKLLDISNIWQEVNRGTINQSEAYFKIYEKYNDNVTESQAKDRLESVQKEIDSTKKVIEQKKALTDAFNASGIASEGLLLEKQQHDADEERKITLATATTQADAVKARNQLVLNDDRSTLEQRLAAIRSNAQQEKNILQAGLNDQLNKPDAKDKSGNLTADSKDAVQKTAEEQIKITNAAQAEVYKTVVDWNDKRLAFLNDINKNQLESDAAVQEAISKNDVKELDVRLGALQKNIDDKTQAIIGDYALQIKLALEHNKTQEEFDKIESDKQKALVDLTANVQKEIYDITLSWGEKRIKAIEDQDKAQNSTNDVSAKYNAQSNALDKSLATSLISVLTYNEKRKKLDEQYAIDSADAEVKDDQKKLQDLKDYQEKYLDIQAAFAQGQLEIAKASGDPEKIAKAQAEVDAIAHVQQEGADLITAIIKKMNADIDNDNKAHNAKTVSASAALKSTLNELAQKSEQFAIELVEASYEKRIQNTERETELADQASEEQIAAVQRSTIGSRQQAEEVAILTAQQRARDVSAKKEERNDKIAEAKFDRDVAVAKVIWSTGAAILKTFEDYGFTPLGLAGAAALAALGAIEVATIEAKPIPTYAEGIGIPGKGSHPGGVAEVGEAGPERITIPGRAPFVVDRSTLLDLPKDSVVEPINRGIISDLGDIGMMRGFAILNAHNPQDNSVERAINNQTSRLEKALKKSQTKIMNKIVINSDTAGLPRDYYDTKILGKRK